MPIIEENKMPKKAKRARRDFAAKVAELELYCRLMVDVLKKHPDFGDGKTDAAGMTVRASIEAYSDVLERLTK